MAKTRRASTAQPVLFNGIGNLQTRIIRRKKDFDSLFDGFEKMQAVSYVISPDLLLDYFDKRGFTEIEVLVGENLSRSYKDGLAQKGIEVTDRLSQKVEDGSLRIFIPSRTIHSKLYILEREDAVRVVQTSANLTESAQNASRQVNYAWILDLEPGDERLHQLRKDYEAHCEGCTLFMEDLTALLSERLDLDRRQAIEAWLKGGTSDEQDIETKQVFQELAASLVETSPNEEQVISYRLPESSEARKRTERLLAPLGPTPVGNSHIHVNGSSFIRYVYENHRIPLLLVSRERRELLMGIDGALRSLTEEFSAPDEVYAALEHLEAYINTVDSGQSSSPHFAKASMFEALLYVFSSPFFHEYVKAKRARFGPIDTRGPRFLYIYGPSKNGKSTFLRFCLKLMTGIAIEPLSRGDFTKTKIANVATLGTAFPLAFDDVDPSNTRGLEDVFKSYWERWWSEAYLCPQIVITSNSSRLKEWAKTRVKRVDFDVHFSPDEKDKERLAQLFARPNPIFKWFSHAYFRYLENGDLPSDDELKLARQAMKELYDYARREMPSFFPNEPIEQLYDPGRKDWRDLLYGLGKASVTQERDRILVSFSPDMQFWEINDYQSYLPQTIKYQRRGNTLVIENVQEFLGWLGEKPRRWGWLARLFTPKRR